MLRGGLATAIRKAWQRYVEYTGNALVCILFFTVISICILMPRIGFRVMITKSVISMFTKGLCFTFIFLLFAAVVLLIDISITLFIDIGAVLILFILTYLFLCVWNGYYLL